MSVRRTLIVLTTGALVCGGSTLALAQAASKKQAPAKQAPAKPEAKHEAKHAAGGSEPTLLGQFGGWGAYIASPSGKKVCFALAKPSSSKTNPPNRPRDPAYAFISTRPSEKVANEVSIMVGYPVKPGSESTLEVGGANYAMYTQGDGLWIKNAAEEAKPVSSRGTQTTDVFSLKGLSQALDRIAQECR
jgi:hypothetical protein